MDELVGVGRDSRMTFEGHRGYIASARQLISDLGAANFDSVPEAILSKIADLEKRLAEVLEKIAAFHKKAVDDSSRRGNLTNELEASYNSLFDLVMPLLGFLRHHGINMPEREAQAHAALERVSIIRAEAEKIINEVRQWSGAAAVKNQEEHFGQEAKNHDEAARRWLWGVLVGGVAVVGAAVQAWVWPPNALVQDSVPLTLFAYLPRLLVISIAFYALALCVRNYRTSRHNFIVNQHRAVALRTFAYIAGAAQDPKVKDAILAQAASTIFSAQPSGYTVDQAELHPQATAVELIQRIAGK